MYRVMTDGHRDNSVGERKLIWDEENRLLAVDDNGFVSNYWYDADGERTVKTSGESDHVYVNGIFSGGSTNTAKFSLYVSPYLVANQGGRYTKHIYAGSQRIVSKVGDFASYGSDPRRIEYAGANTDGLSVDYKSKYAAQQQVIKDNYKFFDVPYNGTDNDNYADGEGFCCNDGSMEAAVAQARKAQTRAVSRSFKDPDNYENLQFFYHPDHLGSSSFITNLDGEVVQHIEYVPFGEVFIEERNNVWNTPYLFNAKELDEETGMYYYGARYYDPRLSLWMSTDPLQEAEYDIATYAFSKNNPVIFIDPNGQISFKVKFGFFLNSGFFGFNAGKIGGTIAPLGGAKQEISISFSFDTETKNFGFGITHTTTEYQHSYDIQAGFVGIQSTREKNTVLDWNTETGESMSQDVQWQDKEVPTLIYKKATLSPKEKEISGEASASFLLIGIGVGGSASIEESPSSKPVTSPAKVQTNEQSRQPANTTDKSNNKNTVVNE